MKIEKLKKMIDVIDAVQNKFGGGRTRFTSSTVLEIDLGCERARVKCRSMHSDVTAALVGAGFSVRVDEEGASIRFDGED